jgi:hypothetical protein
MTREQSPRAKEEDDTDKTVLELLLRARWPWSVEEVGRELGDTFRAEDAAGRLRAAGLAHRNGALLFPTRAAVRAADLDLAVEGENG